MWSRRAKRIHGLCSCVDNCTLLVRRHLCKAGKAPPIPCGPFRFRRLSLLRRGVNGGNNLHLRDRIFRRRHGSKPFGFRGAIRFELWQSSGSARIAGRWNSPQRRALAHWARGPGGRQPPLFQGHIARNGRVAQTAVPQETNQVFYHQSTSRSRPSRSERRRSGACNLLAVGCVSLG